MLRNTPQAIHLEDYRPPPFIIETVDIAFDLDPEVTDVEAVLALRRNPASDDIESPLVLNGESLDLVSLKLDGTPLGQEDYAIDDEHLAIKKLPEIFTLTIKTRIAPAANTALEGLYVSNGMFCTQCEAEGFRRITYFLDRSDVMACFRVTIRADKGLYPVMLSNGNRVESGDLEHGRHYVVWEDPFPKPSYLFALVAGDLECLEDRFMTMSAREVRLELYVRPGDLPKTHHAMESLKRAMRWDEEVFGLEYDLDIYMIVAVGDFNMGAMENKGLNVFNTAYVLAAPETATDVDYANIEGVIGHEYFHNWSGNRVTCRDWFQLSLKEGLTVFRDQEFSADMGSRAVKRIDDVRMLRMRQFPEDAGPMAHPVRPTSYVEINNFYTATVYEKGAEVVRMIHALVGKAGFRQGMDLYFRRHDGQAVTTDDFVAAMSDANGIDLVQFRRWYDQAGTPMLDVHGTYNATDRSYALHIKQSCASSAGQALKQPYHMPVQIGLVGADGRDLPLRLDNGRLLGKGEPLEIRSEEETYIFTDIAAAPVPSVLRGFSAPVRLNIDLDDDELAFLFAHDSDAFNRWEAGQRLAERVLLRVCDDIAHARSPQVDRLLIDAIDTMLAHEELDAALVAEALGLPDESSLTELMDVADPWAIHKARVFVRHSIAHALRDRLIEVYTSNQVAGEYRYHPQDVAKRRLKNQVLSYLVELEDKTLLEMAVLQFRQANNMTDRMGALAPLAQIDCAERSAALADFLDQAGGDALVVDKWFVVQATSRPCDVSAISNLMLHPEFSLKNPNRMRSLIGSFAHRNLAQFHVADGSGYRFIADQVLALDMLNPQMAARLVGAFNRIGKYDVSRQRLAKGELERILAQPDLSKAVYEIVSRNLG